MSILDCFVGKVLADVNVLGVFPAAADVVAPPTACLVVPINRLVPSQCKPHGAQDLVKVNDFNISSRSSISLHSRDSSSFSLDNHEMGLLL
jgi:hypothetical protein